MAVHARHRASILVVFLAAVLFTTSASAQNLETGLRWRFWAGSVGRYVLTDNDPFQDPQFGTVQLEVDGSGIGFGSDVEYKFQRRLGVDVALGYTRFDVDFGSSAAPGVAGQGRFTVMPLLFAVNLHAVSNEKLDVWVGPQFGFIFYPERTRIQCAPGRHVHLCPVERVFPERVQRRCRHRSQPQDGAEPCLPVAKRGR